MHYKRRKSRRTIRCTICTMVRWLGNHAERQPIQVRRQLKRGL